MDGEDSIKILEPKIDSIKELLVDFKNYSKDKFDKIDNHLKTLNGTVASQQVELANKVEEDKFNVLCKQVNENKIAKPFWYVFTTVCSILTGLIVWILTHQ